MFILTNFEIFVIDQAAQEISLSSKRLKALCENKRSTLNEDEFKLLSESVSKLDDIFNQLMHQCSSQK